jgi:Tfp pilus assembly protein PilF
MAPFPPPRRASPRGRTPSRARSLAAGLALGLATQGCALGAAQGPGARSPRLVDDPAARALGLDDPLALDAKVVADVEAVVGRAEMPLERFRHVVRYVTSPQSLNFAYAPFETYTAQQAFYRRRGDCMSFANLVNAIARHVGIPSYFVYVNDAAHHYEHGGWFFTSSHVAVGYSEGTTNYVSDFPRQPDEWTAPLFRRLGDDDAAALFFNSHAVDLLVAGRPDEADRIFSYLVGRNVGVAEIYNNYGVTLKRLSRRRDAQTLFEYATQRFPQYAPLYNNGASLAVAAGRTDLAARWLERYERIAEHDPFVHFVRGIDHYHAKRFGPAVEAFRKATKAYESSATALAWLVRAQADAGDAAGAAESFARLRAASPASRLVRQLRERYPHLGAAAPGGG